MSVITIAIDGPAGAGKSTIAKLVAEKLDCAYLDTGAMYRALGLKALRTNTPLDDEAALCLLLADSDINVVYANGHERVSLDGNDVSEAIRTSEASDAASRVSTLGGVRRSMVAMQQCIAGDRSVVMDGRDIGTCVLPRATLKIFLTASPEVRAKRRLLDMPGADYARVLADVLERDRRDTTRAESPLCKADDAVELDCSELTPEQVVGKILSKLEERL